MNENHKQQCTKLKNQIKYIVSNKGMTFKSFVQNIHDIYGRSSNASSFSTRLERGSLTILELIEALDLINYKFDIKEK